MNSLNKDPDLKIITQYWAKFYAQLDAWVRETHQSDTDLSSTGISEFNNRRIVAVKNHISSTHQWVRGKMRWSKKTDNFYMYPFECKICKMGASEYEKEDNLPVPSRKVDLENGGLPTHDMHSNLIHQTCKDILNLRTIYLHKRKGGKCGQCGTYGCLFNF